MEDKFEIHAEPRTDDQSGSNESRRLRQRGKIPAVMYGGGKATSSILVDANNLVNHLKNEAFYSHILTLKMNGIDERVILRDLQRHPSRPEILHLDLMRVSEDHLLKVNVPLHFIGEDACVGVKLQGGIVSHLQTDVEVSCLPKNLPEFLALDISELEVGHALHLSDIHLPEGVEIIALTHGEENDHAVVSVNLPRVAVDEETTIAAAEEAESGTEEAKGAVSDKDKAEKK